MARPTQNIRPGRPAETESRVVVAGTAVAGGGCGVTANGYGVPFGVMDVFRV